MKLSLIGLASLSLAFTSSVVGFDPDPRHDRPGGVIATDHPLFLNDYLSQSPLSDFYSGALSLGSLIHKLPTTLLHEAHLNFSVPLSLLSTFQSHARNVEESLREFRLSLLHDRGIDLDWGDILEDAVEDLKTRFPPPDDAPGHVLRAEMVQRTLDKVEDRLVELLRDKHEIHEDDVRRHFAPVKQHIHLLVVTTGDLAELHPHILEALLISGALMLVPEAWLARNLLGLFGFSPIGPVKGTSASWLQRRFFGAFVPAGSWFARLESIAMKPGPGAGVVSWLGKLVAGVTAGFGFGLVGCGGRR